MDVVRGQHPQLAHQEACRHSGPPRGVHQVFVVGDGAGGGALAAVRPLRGQRGAVVVQQGHAAPGLVGESKAQLGGDAPVHPGTQQDALPIDVEPLVVVPHPEVVLCRHRGFLVGGGLLKFHFGQAQRGADAQPVAVAGAKPDLGFPHAAGPLDDALDFHRTPHGRGVDVVVVGQEQQGAPSQRRRIREDVAAAQRFVGGGVPIDGCVVQGLLHEQVRHRRFRGHAFDEDALVERHAHLPSHRQREKRPIGVHAGVGEGHPQVACGALEFGRGG